MKQFIKYVLATLVGLFVAGTVMTIVGITMVSGIMAIGSNAATTVDDNTVLVIKLDGAIEERSSDNPLAGIMGGSVAEGIGLDNVLSAIACARGNDRVKGIYIETGSQLSASPASLEEIRNSLLDFKKSGKFIVSYGDNYSQGAYYVCSVADTVAINPQGMLDWHGLASQVVYFKDFFDKLGVSMQVVKVGTYKSAVEPYLLNEMSDANREQITVFEQEIWGKMLGDVAKSRKVAADRLDALADSALMFSPAHVYLKEKLVDRLAYSDEVPQLIAGMMDVDCSDDYNVITVSDMVKAAHSEPRDMSGDIVAVYFACGDIVQEASNGIMRGGGAEIAGEKVIADLKALADDDDVRAVVLRVNSGGGSAYASEQIWHQVMNIRQRKPIVVSMGDYAASGGYYISCAADWIVAQPTTLTGSIGIFGTFPEAGRLLNETLGVHFSTVKTNELADFGDISRPFTESERAAMQRYIDNGYDLFTRRCAEGRNMPQDSIKAIGEGRVWTGLHARQIGLVDQLGGLKDAVEAAKKRANIDHCTVKAYPAKTDLLTELLSGMDGSGTYADAQLKLTLGQYYDVFRNIRNASTRTGIQASLPYYLRWNL